MISSIHGLFLSQKENPIRHGLISYQITMFSPQLMPLFLAKAVVGGARSMLAGEMLYLWPYAVAPAFGTFIISPSTGQSATDQVLLFVSCID